MVCPRFLLHFQKEYYIRIWGFLNFFCQDSNQDSIIFEAKLQMDRSRRLLGAVSSDLVRFSSVVSIFVFSDLLYATGSIIVVLIIIKTISNFKLIVLKDCLEL